MDNGLKFNNDSDAGDGPEYENGLLFDSDNEDTGETPDRDSGYNSDWTDVTMTEDTDDCSTVEVDGAGQAVRQSGDADELDELDEFREARRKYKVLCYEDIYL